jgi:DNA-directed RNA polymerase subunit beta'
VRYQDLSSVEVPDPETSEKRTVALKRNGEVLVVDDKGRELSRDKVPYGAMMLVPDGAEVDKNQPICEWDAHMTPILAEVGGFIRLQDVAEGETVRLEQEGGSAKFVVIEHKGEKHPQIVIENKEGSVLDYHYLPAKARIEVEERQEVLPGVVLARLPRSMTGTQDITGGLPRVTEIFEARRPKEPAVMAEISGHVEIRAEKRRGKMTIVVKSESGMEKEHHVPQDKQLLVHAGDHVEAGDPLIEGPLIPHDILRIRGEEALHSYLLSEIQAVYRSQNVRINDKHLEIIIAQMLRKVKIEQPGDSGFLPGEVVDKFRFRMENERLSKSVVVSNPGDSELEVGQLCLKSELVEINEEVEAEGGEAAKGKRPKPASAATLLLGITKASLSSESFISSASFQETTKVLTEAALCGAVDELRGLKENVILGHLIPAGSGFHRYLNMRIKKIGEPVPVPTPAPTEVSPETLPSTLAGAEQVPSASPLDADVMSMETQRLPLPLKPLGGSGDLSTSSKDVEVSEQPSSES